VNLTATGVATRSVAGDSGLNRIDSTPEIPMLDEVRDGKLVDGERLRQGKHGRAAKFEGRYPHIAVENNDHRLGFNVVLSVALVLPAPAFL